jgi:hypothetical protein
MTAADRLIKEISTLLATGRSTEHPPGALANDYAALCRDANLKLAQCNAMIEKGNEYQALQLAETEPNLMDLAGALSFGSSAAWTEYCAKNGSTVPERLDARYVRALNALYAKGISANHPLYKDYRAAVSSRDDGKALQIIRTITRMNPSDANAKAELERLLNKKLHTSVDELKIALQTGDDGAVTRLADELGSTATPEKLGQFPEWARAADIRHAFRLREAFGELREAAANIEQGNAAEKWRDVGDILRRINKLQAEKSSIPQEDDKALLVRMRKFHENKEEEARQEALFQEALALLGIQVEETEMRVASRSSTTLNKVQADYLTLNKRWQDVERFAKPVPEDLQARVRRNASLLQSETARLKKQRKTKIVATMGVLAVLATAGAVFAYRKVQSGDYAAQLARLRQAREVGPAEKLIASLETNVHGLASMPALRSRIDETTAWTVEEHRKRKEADAEITGLEGLASRDFTEIAPVETVSRMQTAKKDVAGLSEDLRPEAEAKLSAVQNKFDACVASLRTRNEESIGKSLPDLEALATNALGFDKAIPDLKATLGKIEPDLQKIEGLAKPQMEELKPCAALATRISALRSKVAAFEKELDQWNAAQDAMQRATTLDAYHKALNLCKDSLFVQAPEIVQVRKRLVNFPDTDQVWTAMFIPGDAGGWTAMAKDTAAGFTPADVFPAELEKLLALRDNDNLKEIWEISTVDPAKNGQKGTAYSRGNVRQALTDEKYTTLAGSIYNATKDPDGLFFSDTSVMCAASELRESIKPASGTVSLNNLKLNYLIDDTGERYEKPILAVMDELVTLDGNPLFKAYVMQQLHDFINLRPYSWGLQWCPALRRDLATMAKLNGDEPVRSSDWMVPRRNRESGKKYADFFDSIRGCSYFKEAGILKQIVSLSKIAGLNFAGYMGPDGKPKILAETDEHRTFWAITGEGDDRKLTGITPSGNGAYEFTGDVPPFTPLFQVKVNRAELIADACKKWGVPQDSPWLRKDLPPFFTVTPP